MPRNTVSFVKKKQGEYDYQQVFVNGKYFGTLMPYWEGNKKQYEFIQAIEIKINTRIFSTLQEAKKYFQSLEY